MPGIEDDFPIRGGLDLGQWRAAIKFAMYWASREKAWPKGVGGSYSGNLIVHNGQLSMVVRLELPDVDRRRQVLHPLFGVRVQTFEAGSLLIGYRVNADSKPEREVRQA